MSLDTPHISSTAIDTSIDASNASETNVAPSHSSLPIESTAETASTIPEPIATQAQEPLTSGYLLYKKSAVLPITQKRLFLIQKSPIELVNLHAFYKKFEKKVTVPSELNELVAHAATSGEGLLFWFKDSNSKVPSGIIDLSKVKAMKADAVHPDKFTIEVVNKSHPFHLESIDNNRAEWIAMLEGQVVLAVAAKESVLSSPKYEEYLSKLSTNTAFRKNVPAPREQDVLSDDEVLAPPIVSSVPSVIAPISTPAETEKPKAVRRGSSILGSLGFLGQKKEVVVENTTKEETLTPEATLTPEGEQVADAAVDKSLTVPTDTEHSTSDKKNKRASFFGGFSTSFLQKDKKEATKSRPSTSTTVQEEAESMMHALTDAPAQSEVATKSGGTNHVKEKESFFGKLFGKKHAEPVEPELQETGESASPTTQHSSSSEFGCQIESVVNSPVVNNTLEPVVEGLAEPLATTSHFVIPLSTIDVTEKPSVVDVPERATSPVAQLGMKFRQLVRNRSTKANKSTKGNADAMPEVESVPEIEAVPVAVVVPDVVSIPAEIVTTITGVVEGEQTHVKVEANA